MIHKFHGKTKEYSSVVLALVFITLEGVVQLTMLSIFRLFGLNRQNLHIRHLETYLVVTTALIIGLIVASFHWQLAGWILVGLGAIRILQIVALNSMTLMFGLRLLSPAVPEIDRARWHFIALTLSVFDVLLIYGFVYYFFNGLYGILSVDPARFFDHFYFSMVTITTVGYGDVVPVTALGKGIALSETFMGIFLFAFLVNAVVHRFQRHID